MNQTIAFLSANLERARQQCSRTVEVNVLDLQEILSLADSAVKRGKADKAVNSAGWARPGSLYALKSGKRSNTRIARRKSEEFCVELFHADDLREMQNEIDRAKAQGGKE